MNPKLRLLLENASRESGRSFEEEVEHRLLGSFSKPKAGLTKRQMDVLAFVSGFIEERGYSPSLREISAAIGVESQSTAHRVTTQLRSRGLLTWIPNHSRSLALAEDQTGVGG